MNDKDKNESVLSKFSNQDSGSGGYGEREESEIARSTEPRTNAAAKAKKKKKNKAAKKSRKKNRK